MKIERVARSIATLGAVSALAFASLAGCSSDPEPAAPTDFCGVARSSNKTCEEPSDCDAVLAGACTDLANVLSDKTLTAARDCLQSGVCGVASCVSRAQKGTSPTDAHAQLAADFCSSCAPKVTDCEAQFYAKSGGLPGRLVLPYGPDVVAAVDDACTGTEGCQAKFAKCALEVTSSAVAEALEPDVADCVIAGFQDDEGPSGPGGGAQVAKCTPNNCDGCCRDDKCEEGTSETGCGAGAAACEICSGTAQCIAGTCTQPCGPDNCQGCCDGNTCVEGTKTEACGQGGGACEACGAGLTCSGQTCIDASCQATCTTGCCSDAGCQAGTANTACGTGGAACVDCGYGRSCQTGACALDPTSLWDFYVSFAVVPDKDTAGEAWDVLNGAPDPYLVAFSSEGDSSHYGLTASQTDSTFPFWAETPLLSVPASEFLSNLSFDLWDTDEVYDDYIGGCAIPVTAAMFDGSLQNYVCPPTPSGVSVELYFRINPHTP